MFYKKENTNRRVIYVFGFFFAVILLSSAFLVLNNNNNANFVDLKEKNGDLISYNPNMKPKQVSIQHPENDIAIQDSLPDPISNEKEKIVPQETDNFGTKFALQDGHFPTTDGQPIFELNLVVSMNMPERVNYAYQIAGALGEIGIQVNVREMFVDDAFSLMIPATYGDPASQPRPSGAPPDGWDLGLSAWWKPSIVAEWWDLFRCYDPGIPESYNSFGGYCNPDFENHIGDPNLLDDMQRIFFEDKPASIIHHMDNHDIGEPALQEMRYNMDNPFLSDLTIRTAIDMTIPRYAIIDGILSDLHRFSNYRVSNSFVHTDDPYYDFAYSEGGEFGPIEDIWGARQMLFDIGFSTLIVDQPDIFTVGVDLSHTPTEGHEAVGRLQRNLNRWGADLHQFWNIFDLSEETDMLLIPSSTLDYSEDELTHITNWYMNGDSRLLWVAGDSDFNGLYSNYPNNAILDRIGSNLRLSSDSLNDSIYNDGRPYRVVSPTPVNDGGLNSIFSDGVSSAMFHGPTSVLGYQDGAVVDLLENPISGIEIVMKSSENSMVTDLDNSNNEFDYYSTISTTGNYPLMAVQDLGDGKYAIVSGEVIFSEYQSQYDFLTEQGKWGDPEAWNNGVHDGKILVDNVMNWFGGITIDRLYGHAPIDIWSNEDFYSYGFPGSGTLEDPFRIENYFFTSYVAGTLINVHNTNVNFRIGENIIHGRWFVPDGIHLGNVENGLIENNFVTSNWQTGIVLEPVSFNNIIRGNTFRNNGVGIQSFGSSSNEISGNTFFGSGFSGIVIENYPTVHDMRFWQDKTITDKDQIAWQISWLGLEITEFDTFFEDVEVYLTIDGNPVEIWFSDLFWDEERERWRIDGNFFVEEPLEVGEHFFVTELYEDGILDVYSPVVNVLPSGNNLVTENDIFNNAVGIYLDHTEGNLITSNIIHDNWDDGVVLEESNWNRLAWNDIFNQGTGIRIQRTSSENRLIGNNLHHNWGTGIQIDSYSEVFFRFFEHTEATDVDFITWEASWFEGPDEPPIDYVWENLEVILTVDGGDPVEVWFSDIYWDDERQAPKFDMIYWSNPLPVGEYFFDVQFILDGEVYEFTGSVRVGPATDANFAFHNVMAINEIFENGMGIGVNHAKNTRISTNNIFSNYGDGISFWGSSNGEIVYNTISNNMNMGIRVSKDYDSDFYSEYNTIDSNTIYENWENGINLEDSDNNWIINNELFNNWWNGIQLRGTSTYNTIEENTVHNNFDSGIVVESFNEVFMNLFDHIEATDADFITWQAWWIEGPDEPPIDYAWENLQITLTIDDGDPVEVWFSDIYWDEERQAPRFDIYYWSNPLPIGEHIFRVHYFLEGVFENEFTSTVTVFPAIDADFASSNFIAHNILFENSYGIRLFNTIKNTVFENNAFYNYGTNIRIEQSSENIIEGNVVYGSGTGGISLFFSDGNTIAMNQAFENGLSGIFALQSNSNEFSENSVFSNGRGISLQESQENILINNYAFENYEVGIQLENSNNNWVLQNEVFNNWWNGIQVFGTSSYNTVAENSVYQNYDSGIVVESSYNEVFVNFGEDAVATESDNIHWQVSVGDPEYEIAWGHYMTFEVSLFVDGIGPVEVWFSDLYWDDDWGAWRFDVNYWSEPLSIGDHEFTVEFFFNGEYHGPFTNIITVIPATEDNYASNNIVQGNDIYYSRMGIRLFNSRFNTISENIVHDNYEAGIRFEESSENLVASNEVFSNSWGGIEIMFSSNDNNLIWNTAYENGLSGIFAMESSSNVISENVAYQNSFGGVSLSIADNTQVISNEIFENYGLGIWLESSNFNTIDSNDVIDNGAQGIWIGESVANNVTNNEVSGSGGDSGINLYRSYNHYVAENIVSGSYFGILLEHSHSNTLENNVVYNNEDNGINLYQSGNNKIAKNFVFGNWNGIFAFDEPFYEEEFRFWQDILVTDDTNLVWEASSLLEEYEPLFNEREEIEVFLTVDGEPFEVLLSDIYFDDESWMWRYDMNYYTEPLPAGEHTFIVEFVISGDAIGPFTSIVTVVSQGIDIEKNIVINNGRNGIITINKNDNEIAKNLVSFNPWNGIALIRSSNSDISKNFVYKAGDGIFLFQSEENQITKNTVSKSDYNGISIWYSNNNEIINNRVNSNSLDGIQLYFSDNNSIKRNYISKNDIGIHFISSYDNVLKRNKFYKNNIDFLEEVA
ncbi:MAG: NosD domain-containing protein [Candidatus Hodarchaeales archaeon]|jgi:parallel beta-helix repeat protein